MTSSELPRLEDVPAQKVAYIAARGSYEMLPAQMIELAMWFGRQAIDLGGQPGARVRRWVSAAGQASPRVGGRESR